MGQQQEEEEEEGEDQEASASGNYGDRVDTRATAVAVAFWVGG